MDQILQNDGVVKQEQLDAWQAQEFEIALENGLEVFEISNEKNHFNVEKENPVHMKTLESQVLNVKTEDVKKEIDGYRESNKGSADIKPVDEFH